jgi:hypothetical protein
MGSRQEPPVVIEVHEDPVEEKDVEPNNTNETEGEPKDIGEEGANEGIS